MMASSVCVRSLFIVDEEIKIPLAFAAALSAPPHPYFCAYYSAVAPVAADVSPPPCRSQSLSWLLSIGCGTLG
jgi:hypothetical protein